MSHLDPYSLSRYLDGELTLPAQRAADEHLRLCPPCRDELEHLRTVDRTVESLSAVDMPVDAEMRILTAVERRKRRSHVLTLTRMMPAAVGSSVAALLVLISGNIGLLSQSAAHPNTPGAASVRTVAQRPPSALDIARRAASVTIAAPAPSERMQAKYKQMFNID